MKKRTFVLEERDAHPDASPEELAKILLARFGLLPKKAGGTARLEKILLELNEKKKLAHRDKNPELAVMPVEEMALVVGIARQTVYDYLGRWLYLDIIKKTSFVASGRVVIGYEFNGPTIEAAFEKSRTKLNSFVNESFNILELMKSKIKREKLVASASKLSEE